LTQPNTSNTQAQTNTQTHTLEEHNTQNSSNTQDSQISFTHNYINQQIILYNTEEPSHTLPSRGSTGQPRSSQTCGDQKRPPLPLRPRNTNRGLRNPNTIEIRREKRSNKRRVARALNRKGEGRDNSIVTCNVPEAKAQEPTKLKMKIM